MSENRILLMRIKSGTDFWSFRAFILERPTWGGSGRTTREKPNRSGKVKRTRFRSPRGIGPPRNEVILVKIDKERRRRGEGRRKRHGERVGSDEPPSHGVLYVVPVLTRYCYGPVLSVYGPYQYYQMLILGILQLLTSASLLCTISIALPDDVEVAR